MDAKRDLQKEALGVRDEMLPKDSKNQLAGYGYEMKTSGKDIEREDHNRHHQEKEIGILRSYLQNRR